MGDKRDEHDAGASGDQDQIIPLAPRLNKYQEEQARIRKAIEEQSHALDLHTPVFARPFKGSRLVPLGDSAPELDTRAAGVRFDEERLVVDLADGRALSVPLTWFPRLLSASPAQRAQWRLIGRGVGIHWEGLDEDISIPHLLGLPCE